MCGITGWVNFNENLSSQEKILNSMIKTLEKRGPDSEGSFVSNNVLLGHRRLIVVDPEGGIQPMIKSRQGYKYILVYNGELYNTDDLRRELLTKGYSFKSYSDTEVLLTAYMEWGKECLNRFNGIFAFAIYDEKEQEVFLARDQMGVKPLFYSINNNSVIFGSEIKTILAHPYINAEIDSEGITELFALGPAVKPGSAVYKGIYEIAPAHCMSIKKNYIKQWEYWRVSAEENKESEEEAVQHVRMLLLDAINRQLVGDVPICTFLSGGLDSSAISAVAAESFKDKGKQLVTYSIDYEDNDKFFETSLFQPTADEYWAEKMAQYINSEHRQIILRQDDLVYSLKEAVIGRDLPGMADIDSSLYLFCKEIRKDFVVGLSGECADEIFAGYPWFTNKNMINADTFPWSMQVDKRKGVLNERLRKIDLEGYARDAYKKTISEVPHLDNEDNSTYRMKELNYLNLKWFMVNLLNRKDRMSMYNSLEVRVPFADPRIVQYAFNMPVEMKLLRGREKGILREALKGMLPDEIIYRKKSPYPKTHNPQYTKLVCNELARIINDKSSPILELINKEDVQEIISSKGTKFKYPWFGQLMTGPQMMAYLIQVNIWLKEYNVNIIY